MNTPAAPASKVIHCCHCGGPVRVSIKAISVSCPHCHQRVALEDVVIRGAFTGRTLVTCGNVVIEAGGQIHTPIRAENVLVRGVVRAAVVALQRLVVESSGRVYGDVQCARLEVADGGVVSGACRLVRARATQGATGSQPQATTATGTSAAAPAVAAQDNRAAGAELAAAAPPRADVPSMLPQHGSPSVAPKLRPIPLDPIRRPRGA